MCMQLISLLILSYLNSIYRTALIKLVWEILGEDLAKLLGYRLFHLILAMLKCFFNWQYKKFCMANKLKGKYIQMKSLHSFNANRRCITISIHQRVLWKGHHLIFRRLFLMGIASTGLQLQVSEKYFYNDRCD